MKPRFSNYVRCACAALVLGFPHAVMGLEVEPGRPDHEGVVGQAPGQTGGAQEPQSRPVRFDERVVVTADREAENVRDVGSSVSVITSGEIAESGARWLIDVLQWAPGVNVARSGPPGSLTEVFLRGANSGHTLFLIDGVKVNSPTSGGYDMSGIQLSADQIERIEIVRGPQSSLYGSQAIGGVINVITRKGAGAGTWGIEAEGGAYSTGRVHTYVNGQSGELSYNGSVSYFDSQGFSTANESAGNLERDGYRNLSYSARLDYATPRGVNLRGFVRGFDGESDFDDFAFGVGPVDGIDNVQSTRDLYGAFAAGYSGATISTTAEVSVSDAKLDTMTPSAFFTAFGLDSDIYEVDWQNEIAAPGDQQVVAGIEYRREQATTLSVSGFGADGFDEKVDFVGAYAQDRVSIGDRAHVTGGVRYENHSSFGGKWTGRATATVDASDAFRVHGSVGSGFKAPTLNDLYFPGFSNPDLRPEESVGFDFGLETWMAGGRGRIGATFFYNDITNLIQFDFATSRPENVGEVRTRGVELGGEWAPARSLTLAGNYTLTDAKPTDSDDQLIWRPRHSGGFRATVIPAPRLRMWGELRFKGGRFDRGPGGRVAVDAYGLVNLAADYQISRLILVRGRVDNLFDTTYEEVIGYGTAGISAYIGLAVTLAR